MPKIKLVHLDTCWKDWERKCSAFFYNICIMFRAIPVQYGTSSWPLTWRLVRSEYNTVVQRYEFPSSAVKFEI